MKRKQTDDEFSDGESFKKYRLETAAKTNQSELRHAIRGLDLARTRALLFNENVQIVHVKPKHMLRIFMRAVEEGDVKLARAILDKKSDFGMTRLNGQLIWMALKNNDLPMAEMLVRAGANVNTRNSEGSSLLHVLFASKDPKKHDLAILMMSFCADMSALDAKKNSVLHCAIKGESVKVIKELLKRDINVIFMNAKCQTALFKAAQSPAADTLLPVLVEGHNWTPKHIRLRRGIDALCYLTKMSSAKIPAMKALLDMGLDINQVNRIGATALNCAINLQKMNKINLLLDYGADINRRDNFGSTPLSCAVVLPSSKISVLLIQRGASLTIRNKNLEYPLHSACRTSSIQNVRLLLHLGADVNVTNRKGMTPFSQMYEPAKSEAGQLFIKHFAFMTLMGESINDMDIALIYSHPQSLDIYERCMQELARMAETEIVNGILYDCFYTKSIKELSPLARSVDFVNSFYESEKLFPLAFPEMQIGMDLAMKRNNIVFRKEEELNLLFDSRLPYIPLNMIANYLCKDELLEFDDDCRYLIA